MVPKSYRKRRSTQPKQNQTQNAGCIKGLFAILVASISTSLSLSFKLLSSLISAVAQLISHSDTTPPTTPQGYTILPSNRNGVVTRWLVPPEHNNIPVVPRMVPSEEEGYVYILTNPSMLGLIKIGMTKNSPHLRAAELSRGTNVPTPYRLEAYARVSNRFRVERELHRLFAAQRTNAKREFFAVTVTQAKAALQKLGRDYPIHT